jgi:hypothetical protein
MSKTRRFSETLVDFIEARTREETLGAIQGGKLVFGGDEGPAGGSGLPWRGVIGQLNQRLVTYDTTEAQTPITSGHSSLVDNLNRIRYWQKVARWFEPTPNTPRDMSIHVASGVWHYSDTERLEFDGAITSTISAPSTNNRKDLVYLTSGGTVNIKTGTESVSPEAPSVPSGSLPVCTLQLTPSASGIGWDTENWGAYIEKDIRPFLGGLTSAGGTTISGAVNYLDFTPQNPNPDWQEARLFYSAESNTLSYYNDNEDITLNIGNENLIRVKNAEGSTLNNGDVVYVSGSTGDNPQVQLAQADALSTLRGIAVVTQNTINNNAVGYATTYGRVRELDTSSWSAGDTLYISATTPGELTNVKPTHPNFAMRVGWVVRSHAAEGSIFVDTDREIDIFTSGSVLFASDDGELSEDNSNLYWDTTDKRLGIKTTNPHTDLAVLGDFFAGGDLEGITISDCTISAGFAPGAGGGDTPDITFDDRCIFTDHVELSTNSYINWGATEGSMGYGLRDNAGNIEFKDSGGSWTDLGAGGGGTDLTGLGTDNTIARWDGTDTLQDCGISIDDSDNITGINNIQMQDAAWIGIGASDERIVFDAAGDIAVMGAKLDVVTSDNKVATLRREDSSSGLLDFTVATAGDTFVSIPRFIAKRARGTLGSPAAIQDGDEILNFALQGYDGTEWDSPRKFFVAKATENWSNGNEGFKFGLYARENGTGGGPTEYLTINHDGNIGIGPTDPLGLMHGYKDFGGFLYWEGSVSGGGETTIIPDGSNDVQYGLNAFFVATDRSSNTSNAELALDTPSSGSDTSSIFNDGTNQVNLTLYSTGKLTIDQTSGTDTVYVNVWVMWQ